MFVIFDMVVRSSEVRCYEPAAPDQKYWKEKYGATLRSSLIRVICPLHSVQNNGFVLSEATVWSLRWCSLLQISNTWSKVLQSEMWCNLALRSSLQRDMLSLLSGENLWVFK